MLERSEAKNRIVHLEGRDQSIQRRLDPLIAWGRDTHAASSHTHQRAEGVTGSWFSQRAAKCADQGA